jgi:hypothetical protein
MAAGPVPLAAYAAGASWPEPGQIFHDASGSVIVLVLAAPRWPGALRCGGVTMKLSRPVPWGYHTRTHVGTILRPGRRYRDAASGLQVRCLRGGHGNLTYLGQVLLPSSDS